MMQFLSDIGNMMVPFYWATFIAMFTENILLNRAMDADRILSISIRHRRGFVKQGFLLMVVLLISALPLHYSYPLIRQNEMRFPFIPLFYSVFIIAAFFLVFFGVKKFKPRWGFQLDKYLLAAAFSCALLGSQLVLIFRSYSPIEVIGFCIGTAFGYMLASLLVIEGVRRLALCDVPKPFRGMPINLIYIGILSLSFYGLKGLWVAS